MEEGFKFLSKIGVPIHEIAMMMSIALRFNSHSVGGSGLNPESADGRGADFDEGGLLKKAKGDPDLSDACVSAFPPRQPTCRRPWKQVLPRRGGQDEDEAAEVPGGGLQSLCGCVCFLTAVILIRIVPVNHTDTEQGGLTLLPQTVMRQADGKGRGRMTVDGREGG